MMRSIRNTKGHQKNGGMKLSSKVPVKRSKEELRQRHEERMAEIAAAEERMAKEIAHTDEEWSAIEKCQNLVEEAAQREKQPSNKLNG